MSDQILEWLTQNKLLPWIKRGLIDKKDMAEIILHGLQYGFWSALGFATRLKYKKNPHLQKKYEYKILPIDRNDCQLIKYKTTGSWSGPFNPDAVHNWELAAKGPRKRIRVWRNVHFLANGTDRVDYLKTQFPGWKVFLIKPYRAILRREKMTNDHSPRGCPVDQIKS